MQRARQNGTFRRSKKERCVRVVQWSNSRMVVVMTLSLLTDHLLMIIRIREPIEYKFTVSHTKAACFWPLPWKSRISRIVRLDWLVNECVLGKRFIYSPRTSSERLPCRMGVRMNIGIHLISDMNAFGTIFQCPVRMLSFQSQAHRSRGVFWLSLSLSSPFYTYYTTHNRPHASKWPWILASSSSFFVAK